MRINNNLMAMNTTRQLGINSENSSKSMEKLSSGYRINRAGDDAAGLAISEKMRAQIRGLNRAARNAQDGISLIQTTEGALGEAQNIMQRMRELAVQGASGTLTDDDAAEIGKEYDALKAELEDIAKNTDFNGIRMLANGADDVTLQVGANAGETMTVTAFDLETEIEALAQATIDTVTLAAAEIPLLDVAIKNVFGARAQLGAEQNRLEYKIKNLNTGSENLQAAESRIRDVDMASEMVNFTKNDILQQAAMAMLAKANQAPQGVLQLLR
ncbi:MAG: flagellin [Clostridiales bacterium]|jgi:flagellin|nr:flagellin [Clostridiales bacterium]